jgi:hypothetical protein
MIYRLFGLGFGVDVGRSYATLRAGIVMGEMMRTFTRRSFLIASAALPVGCAANRMDVGTAAPASSTAVRPPMIGQTWRYAKHDLFTGALLDAQVDRVSAVDRTIDIASHTEGDTAPEMQSNGANRWRKYFDRPKSAVDLPTEIQSSWGMVLVDPHWGRVQVYEPSIPLWPTTLQPGWQTRIDAKYKSSETGSALPWNQTMKAEAWETVTVPAGQFKALRYVNVIRFVSSDPGRTDSVRQETVWFAPEVGRWVVRESRGSYYLDESVDDTQAVESSFRWELLSWA